MPLPVLGIVGLFKTIIGGFSDHFEGKRKIKQAIVDNKIRLARSAQDHNQEWEMKQLENAGYKDDVLFYAFIAMFVWAGIDSDGARKFFENLEVLPDWFIKIWFAVVASVLGIKKIGDYLPGMISGVKEILGKGKK